MFTVCLAEQGWFDINDASTTGMSIMIAQGNWFDESDADFLDGIYIHQNHPSWYNRLEILEKDTPLFYIVGNLANEEREFMVQFLLNYEAISFRLLGEEHYQYSLTFSLASGYELNLPFILNADYLNMNEIYALTLITFMEPHLPFPNEKLMHNAVSFELIVGNGSAINLASSYNVAPIYRKNFPPPMSGFQDLRVNQQLEENLHDLDYAAPPPSVIHALPGEDIPLAFFAYPSIQTFDYGDNLDDYLIFGFLDWKPVKLNGSPYLRVDATNHDYDVIVDKGIFTIKAPNEPGVYTFIAFISSNPSHRRTNINFLLDSSWAFTIEVIE